MSSHDDEVPQELIDAIFKANNQKGGQPSIPTLEQLQARIAEQEMEIATNFKKLETAEIIKMLVAAENFLTQLHRDDPSLSRTNHVRLQNARVLLTAVLDGKKPDNYDELSPSTKMLKAMKAAKSN